MFSTTRTRDHCLRNVNFNYLNNWLAAISNIIIFAHPEPSYSYKADDSLNELTNDTNSKVTANGVLSGVKKLFTQGKPEDIVDTIAEKILEYAKIKSRRSSDRDLVRKYF